MVEGVKASIHLGKKYQKVRLNAVVVVFSIHFGEDSIMML
jgi:hypothetical protein